MSYSDIYIYHKYVRVPRFVEVYSRSKIITAFYKRILENISTTFYRYITKAAQFLFLSKYFLLESACLFTNFYDYFIHTFLADRFHFSKSISGTSTNLKTTDTTASFLIKLIETSQNYFRFFSGLNHFSIRNKLNLLLIVRKKTFYT